MNVSTASHLSQNPEHHTPMMQQYLSLKSGYPHALLLYRMGDFYELFFDDAKIAAEILGITLTKRGTDKQGHIIPMAGVPFHSADGYIARLINAGQTVVVCEQMDETADTSTDDLAAPLPNQATSKKSAKAQAPKIMTRKVVRTLTAGTLTDDNLITQGQIPTVVALSFAKNRPQVGLAQLDLAKGYIRVAELSANTLEALQTELINTLMRFDPSEVLIDEHLAEPWLAFLQDNLNTVHQSIPMMVQAHSHFLPNSASAHLSEHLQVSTLAGYGIDDKPHAIIAASVVLHYGKQTQQTELAHIRHIMVENSRDYLQLDAISQQNLEIFKPVLASGISLLSVIDHCQTAMGKRLLVHHLHRPLLNTQLINRRLDAVTQLQALSPTDFSQLTETLASIHDIERICGRIGLASAKPTDLAKLNQSLAFALKLATQLQKVIPTNASTATVLADAPLLSMLSQQLPAISQDDKFAEIHALLGHAIVDEPPAHTRDGGMIRLGYDPELDQLRHLHDNIEQTLEDLAQQEREQHQIPTLKVGFNKVSGFYFELSALQAKNAPSHFSRRQTLKNAERFITPALKQIEESYLSAHSQALALEKRLYDNLIMQLQQQLPSLQQLSNAIAYLDVLVNWVVVANNNQADPATQPWCRPTFSDDTRAYLDIQQGRHIVVEAGQARQAHHVSAPPEPFVANDCVLGTEAQPQTLMLITGPNMGGKSTYMRQTALIVLLACCGSLVPAATAEIGRIERIFTRIGSADDLASGKSTFMVEMIETANIMNQANANSLVLMDEVGRGTSTQDGLAIAHACVNYLADNIGCLTLFATHYFELTELADRHPYMFNQHLVTQEINGQLLLLHKIAKGSTHRSFGLHVAKMAGVPNTILQQAQQYLAQQNLAIDTPKNTLEYQPMIASNHDLAQADSNQFPLSLDATIRELPTTNSTDLLAPQLPVSAIEQALAETNPDHLSPKQALEFIYSLKELLNIT